MKEVGKRLKALRESVGFSQVKMAEAIGNSGAQKILIPHSPVSTVMRMASPPHL